MPDVVASRIAALWESGKTGTEIAKVLGTTRSAVLGKIHRMKRMGKIKDRVNSAPVAAAAARSKPRSPTVKRPKLVLLTMPSKTVQKGVSSAPRVVDVPIVPVAEEAQKPRSKAPVPLLSLKPRSCRYIVNDKRGPMAVLYCGEPKTKGAYCAAHYALCYQPLRPRGGH